MTTDGEPRESATYEVSIANAQEFVEIDVGLLRDVVERTLSEERVVAAEISVAVVDNQTIHELNRRHLNHDYETDVLSFLLECEAVTAVCESEQAPKRGAGKRIEGEVVVSGEMAMQRAGEFHWTPGDELILYLVHGLLHLTGYDDIDPTQRSLMRERERDILSHWNLSPAVADRPGSALPPDRENVSRRSSGADP